MSRREFTDEMGNELYAQLYTVLPNRAGDDFVAHLITMAYVQDVLLAQVNQAPNCAAIK